LVAVAGAVARLTGKILPEALQAAYDQSRETESHSRIAEMLCADGERMLILGQSAMAHGQAGWLRQLAAWVCTATGCSLNMVPYGGNTTGAALAGALPGQGCGGADVDRGLDARGMLETPLKGYLLWDIEPAFDMANPVLAKTALKSAESVVAVAAFAGEDLKEVAEVILPLAPLAESEGLYYALDGQSFAVSQAVKCAGQSRPGWKILRRLGADLELDGFAQVDIGSLRDEVLAAIGNGDYTASAAELAPLSSNGGLYRVGEVAMYAIDGLCRRSRFLQQTVHGDIEFAGLSPADAESGGFANGSEVKVSQGGASAVLPVRICAELPAGAVWVKCAGKAGSQLGDSFGPISVEAS
jgi:NADH-quinone oxidoreductase subunit G